MISQNVHQVIERIMIAGILIGVVGMFQPWVFALFGWGFIVLGLSTLGFTVISNVPVRRAE